MPWASARSVCALLVQAASKLTLVADTSGLGMLRSIYAPNRGGASRNSGHHDVCVCACLCLCLLWPSENGYQQAIDDEYPSQKGKSFQNKDHQEVNPPERVASINHMIRHMEVDTTISSPLRTTRSLR